MNTPEKIQTNIAYIQEQLDSLGKYLPATYLHRRGGWKTLKAVAEAAGGRVSFYSLRHSYSVRGHQRGIDNGSMSLAMGHSIEVHCRSYPWATEAGAAPAFDKAEKLL